jgi:FMN reductase
LSFEKQRPLVVGIGGTLRAKSTGQKALDYVLEKVRLQGAETSLLSGEDLNLPMFSPESSERTENAVKMISLMRNCDGLIICSPAYHGSISGLVKNALDYTEDMKGDMRPYFDQVPIGCIAYGAAWQGAVQTLTTLRGIVHALRGWPTPTGAAINSATQVFDADGNCIDNTVKAELEEIAEQVYKFAARNALGASLAKVK